jgi:hypothetical protein
MTVNTETFYPDTCQCVIALAWDDTANPVTYSGVSVVKDAPHNLLTNLNAMSGAPVVFVSGGTLPASGIVVSPIPISGIVVTPTSGLAGT